MDLDAIVKSSRSHPPPYVNGLVFDRNLQKWVCPLLRTKRVLANGPLTEVLIFLEKIVRLGSVTHCLIDN